MPSSVLFISFILFLATVSVANDYFSDGINFYDAPISDLDSPLFVDDLSADLFAGDGCSSGISMLSRRGRKRSGEVCSPPSENFFDLDSEAQAEIYNNYVCPSTNPSANIPVCGSRIESNNIYIDGKFYWNPDSTALRDSYLRQSSLIFRVRDG
jgi:hypothetical protein